MDSQEYAYRFLPPINAKLITNENKEYAHRFLPPIKLEELTPEFQESMRRTSEIISGLDVEKIRSQMPKYEMHEAPLLIPITKSNNTQD